jgi:lauroyl/myristoyl acyltransferase
MDALLYWFAKTLITLLQALPLRGVARLGRWGGGVAFYLDGRHRRVTLRNLAMCFPEKPAAEIRAIAKENFRRLGENYLCAIKTAAMTSEQLKPHFKFIGAEKILAHTVDPKPGPKNLMIALGHFGNFELYARFQEHVPAYQCAATYRALRQPALTRLLGELRSKSGCKFFERRSEADALKAGMASTGLLLGLMVDQHSTLGAVRLPFFGHECSVNSATAVLALRYHCPLHTGICYRTGLAQWQVEAGDEIPTRLDGHPRAVADILTDVNRALEKAILRDPANWFWVHNRWKSVKPART